MCVTGVCFLHGQSIYCVAVQENRIRVGVIRPPDAPAKDRGKSLRVSDEQSMARTASCHFRNDRAPDSGSKNAQQIKTIFCTYKLRRRHGSSPDLCGFSCTTPLYICITDRKATCSTRVIIYRHPFLLQQTWSNINIVPGTLVPAVPFLS